MPNKQYNWKLTRARGRPFVAGSGPSEKGDILLFSPWPLFRLFADDSDLLIPSAQSRGIYRPHCQFQMKTILINWEHWLCHTTWFIGANLINNSLQFTFNRKNKLIGANPRTGRSSLPECPSRIHDIEVIVWRFAKREYGRRIVASPFHVHGMVARVEEELHVRQFG